MAVCVSWIWTFLSFPVLGKFSAIMSSNMVSNSFLLSSPSGTPILWVSVSLILSQSSLKLTSLETFSLSVFFFCSGWVISAALSSILLIHSIVSSNLLLIPSTTAAKSLQSCPTLCNPIDSSPPGSPIPRILQARIQEWIAISFSNAWKWKMKVTSLSRVRLLVTPMDCSLPGSSIHGIFQARALEWGAIAFSDWFLLVYFKFQLLYSSVLLGSSLDFLTLFLYRSTLWLWYMFQ